jgi:phosphatidylserine/phosphatidylglycerophosphate/cardiolipin synthase-like enzyme
MRKRQNEAGLTVNAVAGTHVVYLGVDLSKTKRKGCLGFAVQREDRTENETTWMRGMKTFEATEPDPDLGVMVSSRDHPFQSFQWADYSAKPEYDYKYTVLPLYGEPDALKEGDPVSVRISTENEWGPRHSVFFNRGAVSSQEYTRRFQNRPPDVVGLRAYEWLSRGLLEALVTFIGRADNSSYEIYGAVYEFQWPTVLTALKQAKANGAKVRVIFDAIPGKSGPAKANRAAIKLAKIQGLTTERTNGKLMHNKFFILTKNKNPVAVWTGSTNLTENGIFGHSNCGHAIESPAIARQYLAYWQELKSDPESADLREWSGTENVTPPEPWDADTIAVFSPRKGLTLLDWYATLAGSAQSGLFMTFAFGMHKNFQQVYEQNDGVLRFALMEQEGNGAALPQGKKDIKRIRQLPNVVVAVANSLRLNAFDRWLKEKDKLTPKAHVKWIHTKYMLVDPLGDHPIVVTGSANFSEASTNANEENMLVIRDDHRVADIYLGEFMRLHAHYAFREAVGFAQKKKPSATTAPVWQPKYLDPTDKWLKDYFSSGSPRSLRREYFSGA